MKTYDCVPTMDDVAIIDFCKNGFVMLEGIIPDEINKRTLQYMDDSDGESPTTILDEKWFTDEVILNGNVAGVVRSLLGKKFALPNMIANHRIKCPGPAQEWHTDGGSIWGPELNYLQVFYYPQECTMDMGPTEVLPGSHFLYANRDYMAHYGGIRGSYHTAAPAGSIFVTVYSIWHRRSESRKDGTRNLLKYNYWRTESPKADWVSNPQFDLGTADYGQGSNALTYRGQFRDSYDTAQMYFWLRGEIDNFKLLGGQAWPLPPYHGLNDRPFGIPETSDYGN